MESRRFGSLDVLRGAAVMFILFFHTSIFNYANIHKIDFSDPPLLIILLSFMALWGGIFVMYSAIVNTMMLLRRNKGQSGPKIFMFPIYAGLAYIAFHYILNLLLGRWANDFVNNTPDMTLVAGSLRSMKLVLPKAALFFEGSSLSAISINLMVLSLVLYLLLRNGGISKERRNYLVLGITGTLIMILSFVRVSIYPHFDEALENGQHLLSLFYSFTIANPYPLIPYLAYGILGIMLGMMVYNHRDKLLRAVGIPLGVFFIAYGIYGVMQFEKTISKPDYFWYFKTNFELGIFILMFLFAVLYLEARPKVINALAVVSDFSRISLTIYTLETTVSEVLRKILLALIPSWNQTINGCLLFGGLNVVLWLLILHFWKKSGFRYSIEYFWVLLSRKLGKDSSKMDYLKRSTPAL